MQQKTEELDKLINYLKDIYSPQKSKEIAEEIFEYAQHFEKVHCENKDSFWYKFLNLYTIYPDSLTHKETTPFQRLADHVEWIKKLGCNSIHILPFLDSPMVDKGFDVSDYMNVRPELGTLDDLRKVRDTAEEEGLKIFVDFICNHISEKHEWFEKAESGDNFYRDFFIWRKEKPNFLKKYQEGTGVKADYLEDGEIVSSEIAFPEQAGEIPHWKQGRDGFWYYHTFYPEQPDLDWFNPDVFLEMSKVLIFWTSFGFHFRIDAVPFIADETIKAFKGERNKTYNVLNALQLIARIINPECAFLAETYEPLDEVVEYFGTTHKSGCHLAYNFHMCTGTWISIVDQNRSYIWQKIFQTSGIPKHGEWINFLRNHDELSLAHIPKRVQRRVFKKLIKNGESFREGNGIAGRTMSLIGGNEKRFLMAYCLASSLPGGILVPYGDELGILNTPVKKLTKNESQDMRNINRGRISKSQMNSKKSKRVFGEMSKILNARKILKHYINVPILPIKVERLIDKSVWAGEYKVGSSTLSIFINLSQKPKKIPFNTNGSKTILEINKTKTNEDNLYLGPYGCIWVES